MLADEQINEQKRIRSCSDEEDTKMKGIGSLDKSSTVDKSIVILFNSFIEHSRNKI